MATTVKEKKTACCACEQDMENEIKDLVDNVEGYTAGDHKKKKDELDAAFAVKETKKAMPDKSDDKKSGMKKTKH